MSEGTSEMQYKQDITAVSIAVTLGLVSHDKARSAVRGRTTPDLVSESLHLDPDFLQEAKDITRLPERKMQAFVEVFKELWDQPPPDEVLLEDEEFSEMLVSQRLVGRSEADECLAVQRRLAEARVRPLPRIGDLLVRKGFLSRGGLSDSLVLAGASTENVLPLSQFEHAEVPDSVREAANNPASRIGKYIRTALLGKGGMGEVHKAWDVELGRWAALKFVKVEVEDEDEEDLARLKREAQTAAKFSHKNIGAVYEFAQEQGRAFIAMQYVDGQTLSTYPRNDKRRLVDFIREISEAIHYAHTQGVVHRDIKPDNIMVDTSGHAFIMDFGIARRAAKDATASGQVIGTPYYMSPEQVRAERVDARTDVYSLGATLYDLLDDCPPFVAKSAEDILRKVVDDEPRPIAHVDRDLNTIVLKCLEKDPARRYRTAIDLAKDLRRWTASEPIKARPPSVMYRARKFVARRKAVTGAVTVAVFLGLAAGITFWKSTQKEYERLDKIRKLLMEAEHFESKEKFKDALDRYKDVLALEPSNESARQSAERVQKTLDELSEQHLTQKERLKEILNDVRDRVSNSDTAYSDFRLLFEKAEDRFREAQRISAEDPEVFFLMARMSALRDDFTRAVDLVTSAIDLAPENVTYRTYRIVWQAERVENQVMNIDCDIANGKFHAISLQRPPLSDIARRQLENDWDIVLESGTEVERMLAQAAIHIAYNDFGKAREKLKKYVERRTGTAEAWLLYSIASLGAQKARDTLKATDGVLRRMSNSICALHSRIWAYLMIQDFQSARLQADKILNNLEGEINANGQLWRAAISLQRAYVNLCSQRWKDAIADLKVSIDGTSDNSAKSQRHFLRAYAYKKDLNLQAAISDYTEAINLDGKFAEALFNRGNIRFQQKDWDNAIEDANAARRIRQGYEKAELLLAIAH